MSSKKVCQHDNKEHIQYLDESIKTWNRLIEEIKMRNARIRDAVKETDIDKDQHKR